MPRPRKNGHPGSRAEERAVRSIDDLQAFDDFVKELLPALRNDLSAGLTADDLYKKYQSIAAARSIQIAMSEIDSGKALSAVKDILDRTQGKATERSEVTHRLDKLPDEQLDALLLSEMGALKDEECSTKRNSRH
jgi:hypothetical protein